MVSWGGRSPRSPPSYPAVCGVVSQGLLCSLGPDPRRVGSRCGAGSVVLTDGFEGAEEGTVVIRGVPCPEEWGETGSGQRNPLVSPEEPRALAYSLGKCHLPLVPPPITPLLPRETTPPAQREGPMSLGPQRRKTPGTGELGEGKACESPECVPPHPESPRGCRVSPGKGSGTVGSACGRRGTPSSASSRQRSAKQR